MRRIGSAVILLLLAVTVAPLRAETRSGDPRYGKLVYQRYCVSCHGRNGDGAGDAADQLTPRPRDFRQGTFKFRSTASGSLPTVEDIDRTLQRGVYGTVMPSWFVIGPRARRDVIAYVQLFSSRWEKEPPPVPLTIPAEPKSSADAVKRGAAQYENLGCASCHGETGRGDGQSAKDLKDDWGNSISPPDFTTGRYKSGQTATDLYRVLMTGLNGTPMPSFADNLKPEETWDLVDYLLSLASKPERRASAR